MIPEFEWWIFNILCLLKDVTIDFFYNDFCLRASYKIIDADDDTFNESFWPSIGIEIVLSDKSITLFDKPLFSDPKIMAKDWLKLTSVYLVDACGDVANVLILLLFAQLKKVLISVLIIGIEKKLPILDRITFGLLISVLLFKRIIPLTPTASLVLIILPKFPGFSIFSITRKIDLLWISKSFIFLLIILVIANIPSGFCLYEILSNTFF